MKSKLKLFFWLIIGISGCTLLIPLILKEKNFFTFFVLATAFINFILLGANSIRKLFFSKKELHFEAAVSIGSIITITTSIIFSLTIKSLQRGELTFIEFIGGLSGFIVLVSGIQYMIRAWQKKVTPKFVSWGLWTLISFSVWLNYKSSGAQSNSWPALIAFVNTLLIFLIIIWKRKYEKGITNLDFFCLISGLISFSIWFLLTQWENLFQGEWSNLAAWFSVQNQESLANWGLYVGILADAFAAIPMINFTWKSPKDERPGAWLLYSFGYGLGFFAVPFHSFSNDVLPIYMFLGAFTIALPLIKYRIQNKISFKEWI